MKRCATRRRGFEAILNQTEFIRARQHFWKAEALRNDPTARILGDDETPIETKFVVFASGPSGLFGVFEDEGETGYLYLFSSRESKVLQFLHIYNQSAYPAVSPEDVRVFWTDDGMKCRVEICGQIEGIIEVSK